MDIVLCNMSRDFFQKWLHSAPPRLCGQKQTKNVYGSEQKFICVNWCECKKQESFYQPLTFSYNQREHLLVFVESYFILSFYHNPFKKSMHGTRLAPTWLKFLIRRGIQGGVVWYFCSTMLVAQTQQPLEKNSTQQGILTLQHEFTIAVGTLPAWKAERNVEFRAIDAAPTALRDTLNSAFRSRAAFGELGFTLRYGMVIDEKVSLSLAASPYFGSFASEQEKKDRVYGVQFDFTAGYRFTFVQSQSASWLFAVEPSCRLAYTIGGYSLGYFSGVKKEWLQFGETKFYDAETAFHLIDNNLGIAPCVKALWNPGGGVMVVADVSWMLNLSRQTVFNIAGVGADKQTVEWLQKPLENESIRYEVDGRLVRQESINEMFGFTRLSASIGLVFRL